MGNNKIECQINYINNDKSVLIENQIINDYKNKNEFDKFKKKIINTCISNLCDKILLTLNYEENIVMYITCIGNNEYITEVHKISSDNNNEYLETFYMISNNKYNYYQDNNLYWFPLLVPMFFFPFFLF